MKKDVCERCGKQVDTTHLDRHKMGKECQFRTEVESQIMQDWHACSRQLRSILDEFDIAYRTRRYMVQGSPLPAHQKKLSFVQRGFGLVGEEMEVVFVEGNLGLLCRGLKAKPLRWTLRKLKTDIEFGDAMQSVVLMEGRGAAVQFAGVQWQNRKGVHKHKTVEARRAKT